MVAARSTESITVPLKLEGVIVGYVALGEHNELLGQYTNHRTESHIKELLLSDLVESFSLTVDYVGEPHILGVPEPGDLGQLRLL